jgi:tRNA G18 (ribose-2'-O)-methylase SpoU
VNVAGGRDPLDDYRALNDPARRRAVERRGGYFVVEGLLAVEALLESRYPVRSVVATERRAARVRDLVGDRAPVLVRSEDEVAAVAGFDVHRGVLAAADRMAPLALDDAVGTARVVLVTEGVGDHENLGALFRNAAALGAGAVVLDPTTGDPLYRRSVRVSLGHVLRVPWARLGALPAGIDDLRARGFTVLALTPSPDAVPIDEVAGTLGRPSSGVGGSRQDQRGTADTSAAASDRLALLVGAEGPGLTPATLAAADRRVRIPLAPGVDSLNVATAAAIALHRLARPGS